MNRQIPTHCHACNGRLRPKGQLAANHPGTKSHACNGLCSGCWQRAKRNSPPPAPSAHTLAGLHSFLQRRRNRIQTQGNRP